MDFSCKFAVHSLMTILVLCTHHLQESSPLSIDADKEALISFKSQVSSEVPSSLSSWDQNLSPCNWSGVSCNNHGRVVSLDLSFRGLTGSISPSLGNLSFLRSLELQNNRLSGEIPNQICNLLTLRILNLSSNDLQGSLPSNISNWKVLEILGLANNNLSGNLALSLTNMSSLIELNLATNFIPHDVNGLVKLKLLDLSSNTFSGPVPSSLYNMSSLQTLILAGNHLSGELPGDIGITLPKLVSIRCCYNNFTGQIPWSLHNLTNIRIIRLASNSLHGIVPPGLGNLPNLEMYNIANNSIASSGPRGLDFLELLTNSTRLNFLAIDYNRFEGMIPKSIGNLSNSLTRLYMGGNNIYGNIPPSIGELTSLGVLNLSQNYLSGEIPSEIGNLQPLTILGLADNLLSGELPSVLGNLTSLTRLDLSRNQLIGQIPRSFGNLHRLVFMDLSKNKISGSLPVEIVSLTGLSSYLNLSQNQLTGPLPSEIHLLTNVAVINISDNKLSGNIPQRIGECESLEKLSLARNILAGPIPNTLGSIRGLEVLDLSSNQLSGPIPLDLQNLHSLQLLNLSFNKLEGIIPIGGVFANPSKVHLGNNANLSAGCLCHITSRRPLATKFIVIICVAVVGSLCIVTGMVYYYIVRRKMDVHDTFTTLKSQAPLISYDELRIATDNFSEQNIIGRGSIGFVYKGLLKGVTIAVKVLDVTIPKSREIFWAECAALRHVKHRNLVKLITICSSINSRNEEFLAFVLEYMSNGSLDDWITGERRHENGIGLSVLERLRSAIGIATAIEYLHCETEVAIVHCDLKPGNVLLDSEMIPKVADFGLAKLFIGADGDIGISMSSSHTLRGSVGYIPPEYGYEEKPSKAGDMYSFGVVLLELFTGKSPTHEMFTGSLSLMSWVQNHFPDNINQILDPELLQQIKYFLDEEEHPGKLKTYMDPLATIFGVGLSCVAHSPWARIDIKFVLRRLKNVEKKLLQDHQVVPTDSSTHSMGRKF